MSLLRTPRNPKSPRGFQPLDDGINEDDDAQVDKSGTTLLSSTSRRKKHHFNFLSRSSKKRTSAASSKSTLTPQENILKAPSKELAPPTAKSDGPGPAANVSSPAESEQISADQKEERMVKASEAITDVSVRDDATEQSTTREVEAVSVNGAEERDGPPGVAQDRYASDGVLQQPFIVRRKEQNSPAPRVVDNEQTYSNELMLDPSVPPPAWCANFSVIDDAAPGEVTEVSPVDDTSEALFTDSLGQKPSATPTKNQRSASFDFGSGSALPSAQQYPNLMSTTSEDAADRPSSPLNLRRSRSVECFGNVSKRGSASPVRARPSPEMGMLHPRRAPSPEMGMRPPRRANAPGITAPGTPPLRGRSPLRSASPLRCASPLRSASPKPEATSRRISAPNTSPVPNRGRASPKPPRPHGQSVLGSLVGGGDNKRPSTEPSSSSPKPFEQFAPVLPSLDKLEGSATKAKPTGTGTTRGNPTVASSKASPLFVLDRAVITIQSAIRGHQARQEALVRMGSVLMIQSVIRRHMAVVECFSRRGSIVSIQAWYRGEIVRGELQYLRWSAIQIQSSWRQHVARRDFGSTKSKLIVAQSVWRGHIAQKNYRMSKERVTKIQTLARQRAAEKNLQKSKNAAISIQASVRAAAAKNHFDASRAAASTIQASFRGAACRNEYKKTVSSAIRIQALARTSSVRAKYITTIQGVVRLQALAREVEAKKRYQSTIAGVTKLQAIAMRIAAQRRYDATRRVAIVSQSFARQMKARRNYLSAIKAIVLMQSAARMASDRKQYSGACLSIIRMQACIRRAIAERKAVRLREEAHVVAQENHAAVVVQSNWRRFVAKENFAEFIVSASLIQMYWRRYQAICTVERLKAERERRLQIELEERRNNAATLIQSTWRGYYHEMAYVDAIIAATIIQAYTRRYRSQCAYATLLQLHKEAQAREQQCAAEQEALRRSEIAVQRRKVEQERLEAERLKKEERERAEKQRLEAERLVQEERERNEQRLQVEREERARVEAGRIQADEKEQQTLEADIVAEFKETRNEENKAESRRVEVPKRQETERSAVRPSEGPMSPPKRSVITAGASPSIKDRIRMFSGGSSAAAASPSPVPFGRSASPYQKPTFRSPSSVAVAKKTPVVATSTNTSATPKSPLPRQQGNSSDKAPSVHESPAKAAKESSSPVPARTVAAKESSSPVPVRTFAVETSSPAEVRTVVQSPTKAEISPASKTGSPHKAQPNASGGSSFDFNQIKNRFVQQQPSHRSPEFQRSTKTKVVEWEVPQMPPAKQVETDVGDRAEVALAKSKFGQSPKQQKDFNQIKNRFDAGPGHDNVQKPPEFVAVAKSKFGQSPRQQSKLPAKQSAPVSQAIHDSDGWEDFGSIPSFRKTFGGTSPSWKKTQHQSRAEVDSCPDDVLNSFKQIQASAAAKSPAKYAWKPSANASPATRSSPKPKSPSNAFKLRPCRKDTPTLDHKLPNPVSPPRTRSGKSYQGDNSWRREMRMKRN